MAALFLLFTLVPFVELYLLISIGQVVGSLQTLWFVIAMGVVGAWLAQRQGRRLLAQWSEAASQGRVPEEGVLGGMLVCAGGLLLITPGVLTDVVGVLCLIPVTRRVFARALGRYFERRIALGQLRVHQVGFQQETQRRPVAGDVIDTEGEELH